MKNKEKYISIFSETLAIEKTKFNNYWYGKAWRQRVKSFFRY